MRRIGLNADLAHEVGVWCETWAHWDKDASCTALHTDPRKNNIVRVSPTTLPHLYAPYGMSLNTPQAPRRATIAINIEKAANDRRRGRTATQNTSLDTGVYKIGVIFRRPPSPVPYIDPQHYPYEMDGAVFLNESGYVQGVRCCPNGVPNPATVVMEVDAEEESVTFHIAGVANAIKAKATPRPKISEKGEEEKEEIPPTLSSCMVYLNRAGDTATLLHPTSDALDFYYNRKTGAVPFETKIAIQECEEEEAIPRPFPLLVSVGRVMGLGCEEEGGMVGGVRPPSLIQAGMMQVDSLRVRAAAAASQQTAKVAAAAAAVPVPSPITTWTSRSKKGKEKAKIPGRPIPKGFRNDGFAFLTLLAFCYLLHKQMEELQAFESFDMGRASNSFSLSFSTYASTARAELNAMWGGLDL